MGKKTTIKLKDLEEVIKNIPKEKIEVECRAWGCVTPHYKEVIEPSEVMYYIRKFLEQGA